MSEDRRIKELERRDAIKETIDNFIDEIIEIDISKEDISYIFGYLRLELERICKIKGSRRKKGRRKMRGYG